MTTSLVHLIASAIDNVEREFNYQRFMQPAHKRQRYFGAGNAHEKLRTAQALAALKVVRDFDEQLTAKINAMSKRAQP